MGQTYPLSRVIEKVAAAITPEEDHQRLVTVDVKNRQAVPRRVLWRDYRYYRVSSGADPANEARVEMEHLPLGDLDHQLYLAVSMQLSCPPGNEERVAEALFDVSRSPGEMLERHITRFLVESSRGEGVESFVHRYFADPVPLQKALADALLRETGLQARVKLALDAEKSLNALRIDLPLLEVLVKDFDEQQDMGVRMELEVDPERRAAAALHFPRNLGLPKLVREETKAFVRGNVTLQEFCTTFATGSAREGLAEHLNHALAPAGRRVGALVLQPRVPEDLQPQLHTDVPVACRVHEFPEKIIINNNVLLRLQNLARYRAAGSPPLEGWLHKQLDDSLPHLLFDARYIDLLIRFQPLAVQIEETLRRQAEAIGYEIRQFITVPDLDPIRLRENFPVDTTGTFETRLRNVQVELQIVVTARIPRLQAIESYLNSRQDVPALMAETVLGVVRERLHDVEPERFYMRFRFADHELGEEQSVEEELMELIRERLQAEYAAEVPKVVIKVGDTDLIERFNQLKQRICPFEVVVDSLGGGEPVTFRGDFRVMSVHPEHWHEFQMLTLGLEAIRDQLEMHLLTLLQTKASEALRFREDEQRDVIERFIVGRATRYAAENFGLVIRLMNVRRDRTGVEAQVSAAETDVQLGSVAAVTERRRYLLEAQSAVFSGRVAEIRRLQQARELAVAGDGSAEEIDELDRKIEERVQSLGVDDLLGAEQLAADVLRAPVPPLRLPKGDPARNGAAVAPDDVLAAEP